MLKNSDQSKNISLNGSNRFRDAKIMSDESYQFSGSLPPDAQTYVTRRADSLLLENALSGKFCYVLSSRQMGKSSLRVRTIQTLRSYGVVCGEVDLLQICDREIQKEQWYVAITKHLSKNFELPGNFKLVPYWLNARKHFTTPDKILLHFLTDIVLPNVKGNVVLFVDEIDSVLSLGFSVEEFFGLIRQCDELKAEKPELGRLSWVLLGVARPEQLSTHPNLNPFKLGQKIQLTGFRFDECDVLLEGLRNRTTQPYKIIKAILAWTGGQPFLTQKLCKLVAEYPYPLECDREANIVKELVEKHILNDWERQDNPDHLRPIRKRLLEKNKKSPKLLELYARLLHYGEIPDDRSSDAMELYLSGLAVPERMGDRYPNPVLRTCNRIYSQIFNKTWLQEQGIPPKKYSPLPPIHLDREAKILHDHFKYVRNEDPEVVIGRFRSLFITCVGYREPDVEFALRRFILDCSSLEEFNNFFNLCCHILVNYWKNDRSKRLMSFYLLELLEDQSKWNSGGFKFARKMHLWMQEFTQGQDFLKLKETVNTSTKDKDNTEDKNQKETVDLRAKDNKDNSGNEDKVSTFSKIKYIYHYPFLYPLLRNDNQQFKDEIESLEYKAEIERQKNERRWQMRCELKRCVRVLLRQHRYDLDILIECLNSINPTLLDSQQLFLTLKYCLGKSSRQPYITRELAQRLRQKTIKTETYAKFKELLLDYLVSSVATRDYLNPEQISYIGTTFKDRLEKYLESIHNDKNDCETSEFLLLTTCSELINFLVATPDRPTKHAQFATDFLYNCSPLFLTETIVKLILLSYHVKPHLESNLANIFKHYENLMGNQIEWLIPFFEIVIIELTIYLGELDFPHSNLHPKQRALT